MKKLLAVLATAALAFTALGGEFPDISVSEVKALTASKKAVIIDVNGTDSFKEGHIPGALNFERVSGKLDKVLPSDKNTLIVAYCGGPACRAYQQAANAAEKLGYKNVKHMSAGLSGWKKAGEPLEKGGKKAKVEKEL